MFKRILVPLDGSSLAECVIPHAMALSLVDQTEIHLLRVVNPIPTDPHINPGDPLEWKIRKVEAEAYLEEIAPRFGEFNLRTRVATGEGKPAETIIEYANEHGIDLIVLSSHGKQGLTGWNISSVVQKVILRAPASIMLVRAYHPAPAAPYVYKRIMVPLDGSRRAETVLRIAVDLARAREADLLIAHVIAKPEMPRRRPLTPEETELAERVVENNRAEIAHYLSELKQHIDLPLETHLFISNKVASRLHRFVEEQEVDLVVLTAHGFEVKAEWPYGSVVTTFIAFGTTPLLVFQDIPAENIPVSQAEAAAKEYGDL
jgi:nucleotide-binding universal stress UspA family protein